MTSRGWHVARAAVVVALSGAAGGTAGAQSVRCALAPKDSISFIEMPGRPFQALPSADGCWAFVSIVPARPGDRGGIAVLRNSGGRFVSDRLLHLANNPAGMVLTHDGTLLIVSSAASVTFIDVDRLVHGRAKAVAGTMVGGPGYGRVYANVTRDDRYLFVSNENRATISVIDLVKARANGFSTRAVIGEIPTGRAPIALVFSPDEKLLYATSQEAPASVDWPVDCRPQGATSDAVPPPNHRHGAILVIDMARAVSDPAHAVVNVVRAGCNPVRVVLSPDGTVAYVSARTDNALLAFDTRRFVGDTAGALLATVPVGTAPVGVAVADSGRTILVTSSNRFGGDANDRQAVTVIDAAKMRAGAGRGAVRGEIQAGAFPREMRVAPGGRVLLLTNFASSTVQVIDLTRLP